MVTYRFTIEITTYAAIMSNSSGQIFLFLNFPELRWTAFEVGDTQQLVYSRQHFFPLKNNKKVPKSPKCGAVKRREHFAKEKNWWKFRLERTRVGGCWKK